MSQPTPSKDEPRHPIQVVARRTGLSPDALRVWERRHGAVRPKRSAGGQRLYSDADVERLRILNRLIRGGRRIGQIGELSLAELESLLQDDETEALPPPPAAVVGDAPAAELEQCLEATAALDGQALESFLNRAAVSLGVDRLLDSVILPAMRTVGAEWRRGKLTPAHEHLLSAKVRQVLGRLLDAQRPRPGAPEAIVTTPAGEHHDLSALAAAVLAAGRGWSITFLGPNMPADDVAAAARQREARAVVLAVVHPDDEEEVAAELERLARKLPPATSLLVGGAASAKVAGSLRQPRGRILPDLSALTDILDELSAA